MDRFRWTSLGLCFLVCAGLVLSCDQDEFTHLDQGLDPGSLLAGAVVLGSTMEVPDPESCRAACCDKPGCDLALVGYPADGGPQCQLVTCVVRGRDLCVLRADSQFKVYRRRAKAEARTQAEDGGEGLHVVPLMGVPEPKSNETNNILCRLPMKTGSCRASFPKFFYNVTSQSCQSFIYGGCGANNNNFDTQEECEAACNGVTGSVLPDESTPAPPQRLIKAARMAPAFKSEASQESEGPAESEPAATESAAPQEKEMTTGDFEELCGVKPDAGLCKAAFQRWYYNRETGSCEQFIYGGCQGNKNNHHSRESCIATCTVTVLPSSKKDESAPVPRVTAEDSCMMTPDPGPCRAAFTKFYFDQSSGSCKTFMYGGCRGNENRYNSAEECKASCDPPIIAIFLFVALAAISALILALVIFVALKRRKQYRRTLSVSDKEELLPDEQSSMESLAVPESPKPNKA
ncbi:hypothetical protein L3Q82_018557 [Scortum barcoo]|uniref:Uncharacterized protein n=1 Tax=Scortum barcoo TaxID=214431 RepID=A0ACB8VF42_9TELE|nr:hypothetical protein L3Q82_018557 [Scortum barcoo]